MGAIFDVRICFLEVFFINDILLTALRKFPEKLVVPKVSKVEKEMPSLDSREESGSDPSVSSVTKES